MSIARAVLGVVEAFAPRRDNPCHTGEISMQDYMRLLGFEGRDRVAGAAGVVEGVCFDLYGCVQVILKPKIGKDGKQPDSLWLDWKRIEVTSKKPVMPVPVFARVGDERGPADKPAPSSLPPR